MTQQAFGETMIYPNDSMHDALALAPLFQEENPHKIICRQIYLTRYRYNRFGCEMPARNVSSRLLNFWSAFHRVDNKLAMELAYTRKTCKKESIIRCIKGKYMRMAHTMWYACTCVVKGKS